MSDLILGFALGVVMAFGFVLLSQVIELQAIPVGYFRGPFG